MGIILPVLTLLPWFMWYSLCDTGLHFTLGFQNKITGILQASFGMRDSRITQTNRLIECQARLCNTTLLCPVARWKAGRRCLLPCPVEPWLLCVFFCVSECASVCEGAWDNAFQGQFVCVFVCVCVCMCVNGLCSQRNRVKTYRWSILSRIRKQVCVCATTSEPLQVCATCSWGNFNDVYSIFHL